MQQVFYTTSGQVFPGPANHLKYTEVNYLNIRKKKLPATAPPAQYLVQMANVHRFDPLAFVLDQKNILGKCFRISQQSVFYGIEVVLCYTILALVEIPFIKNSNWVEAPGQKLLASPFLARNVLGGVPGWEILASWMEFLDEFPRWKFAGGKMPAISSQVSPHRQFFPKTKESKELPARIPHPRNPTQVFFRRKREATSTTTREIPPREFIQEFHPRSKELPPRNSTQDISCKKERSKQFLARRFHPVRILNERNFHQSQNRIVQYNQFHLMIVQQSHRPLSIPLFWV